MALETTFIIHYYTQDTVGEKPKLPDVMPHRIRVSHDRLRAQRDYAE